MSAETVQGDGDSDTSPWVFWLWANMYATFRAAVDHLCLWGLQPFPSSMDTLGTLLIGWLIFGVLILIVAKFLYSKFLTDGGDDLGIDEPPPPPTDESEKRVSNKTAFSGGIEAKPIKRNKAKIVPDEAFERISAPLANGSDPDAVRWINSILVWFYEGSEGGRILKDAWNDSLNDFTVGSALETGVLVEVLELYPQTPQPRLSNLIVDCSPIDDMTLTCDLEATFYLVVRTTRTQKDVTTESEYACAVRPLKGRLNVAIVTKELTTTIKLVGWPEITLELEGIRNNSEGLKEEQLQEVVKEVLSNGLRNTFLELEFASSKTFPRFKRSRQAPDPVMPVGYDSLVRERQTHPPAYKPQPKLPTPPAPVKPPADHSSANPVVSGTFSHHSSSPKDLSSSTFASLNLDQMQSSRQAAFSRTPQGSDSIEDERIEEAGESFTSLNFPSHQNGSPDISPTRILTPSEESLIAKNIEKYDKSFTMSPEAVGIPKIKEKYSSSASEAVKENSTKLNSLQSLGGSTEDQPDTILNGTTNLKKEFQSPQPLTFDRGVMVSSMRKKLIDEPALMSTSEDFEEEDDTPDMRSILQEYERSLKSRAEDTLDDASRSPAIDYVDSASGRNSTSALTDLLSPPGKKAAFAASNQSSTASAMGIQGLTGKRLLVKVVKASGIGGTKGVQSSYVVVEMDDPPQKFNTSIVNEEASPFWDEQFLFDLSDNTLELLFEIYEKESNRFLGLGIVGIEELVATPSQRQIIPLQARPYEKDEVSGSLTCEFLFLDRADLPEIKLRATSSRPASTPSPVASSKPPPTTTTTKTYTKGPEISATSDEDLGGGSEDVTQAALKDLGVRPSSGSQFQTQTKSTLIIHSSRKPEEPPKLDPSLYMRVPSDSSSSGARMGDSSPQMNSHSIHADDRGRNRNRKRDFFVTMKKRLSRSKARSQSSDHKGRDQSLDRDPLAGRSVSVERSANLSKNRAGEEDLIDESLRSEAEDYTGDLLSVPMGGRSSNSRVSTGGDSGSTRSSLSGTSGLSSVSTKTFIHEASLLVIEALENGVIKHYLVPLSMQRKSKWKKKGTKLHIFNEHTFIAKHLTSSTECQVCNKNLSRRPGKQGYECRDCAFKCHKPCHVKADIVCPYSTVNSMDLVYIKDDEPKQHRKGRLKNS